MLSVSPSGSSLSQPDRQSSSILQRGRSKGNSSPTARRDQCCYCNYRHPADHYWYKNPHLRRNNWQPNRDVLRRIAERGLKTASNLSMQPPPREEKGKFLNEEETDIFSSNYGLTSHAAALALYAQLGTKIWIADSGTNQHCCNHLSLFSFYEPHPLSIGTGNGAAISPGRGTVDLSIQQSSGSFVNIHLVDVRYTPTSLLNMISEDLLEQRGIFWRGETAQFIHLSSGHEFAHVIKTNGLRVFTIQPHSTATNQAAGCPTQSIDINLLHRRFGHLHVEGIKEASRQHSISLSLLLFHFSTANRAL